MARQALRGVIAFEIVGVDVNDQDCIGGELVASTAPV